MKTFERASLSPEQEQVIHTWGKGLAVLAGAGSGKTTTLVSKCVKLNELFPNSRFVAVSFTERSASDLKEKLSEQLLPMLSPGEFNQNWIMTIHGLCASILREYPRESGFDGEENILSESESQILWERAFDSIWIESLPDEVQSSLEKLLDRENREQISQLLRRVKDLHSFGVLDSLQKSDYADSRALVILAEYVIEKYKRLKWKQGAIDFSDLEIAADCALEFPHVRETYHRRFELVLVDEFQDTNPVQARIIWRFARPDLSNLCVVGDPKQSIYRFRDADVSTFEEFCARLPVQLSLTWNFRSRPAIIEFANQICESAFRSSNMKFEALKPKRENTNSFEPVVRLDIQSPHELGVWIQSEVNRGIPLHEMALLVRKIRGNEKWLKALNQSGIPIAVGSGGLFWEDPRVRELVAFLKWWDNPENSLSGAIFLRAPWMAISDLDLEKWLKQDPTWVLPFFDSQHPVAHELRPFFRKIVRPGQILMALLANEEIENELGAPLLGLWHRVEEFSSQGMDFHSIVIELARSIEENRRERQVPAPRNLGQLIVLTFHGAKGLEFPHVILIDFGSKPRAPNAPLLYWDRQKGAFLGQRDENGERDKKSPLEITWREIEKNKDLAESKRLFYVALTRAKERLILVCPEMDIPQGGYDSAVVLKQDFWRAWIECYPSYFTKNSVELTQSKIKVKPETSLEQRTWERQYYLKALPMIRARHSVTEWTLLSRCPRAYEWTFIRPRLIEKSPPPVLPELIELEAMPAWIDVPLSLEAKPQSQFTRTEIGNRVHACLENGDLEDIRNLEKELGPDEFKAEPLIQWVKNSHWMKPAELQKGREVWTELNFEVPWENEILVGTIDRLVVDPNAKLFKYSIIDFKVTDRPKPKQALLEAYHVQLELYAWALTRLDPQIPPSEIEAVLVNISRSSVQVISVELGKVSVERILEQSRKIVRGHSGRPKVGPLCSVCDFRGQCEEFMKQSVKNQQLKFQF